MLSGQYQTFKSKSFCSFAIIFYALGLLVIITLKVNTQARALGKTTRHFLDTTTVSQTPKKTHRADSILMKRIDNILSQDSIIADKNINVIVKNGQVYIYGLLNLHSEIELAKQIVSGAQGVSNVTNRLYTAETWTKRSDWEIDYNIERDFVTNPNINKINITVLVENGIVTLAGIVENWYEWREAIIESYKNGAKKVIDQIIIKP
jgi:osmotically-inducible protein OsmY